MLNATDRAVVRRPDHVVVAVDDAPKAHEFCADVLMLPVAWPFEDFGGFASGGIGLGNLNLEFCLPGTMLLASTPARVGALAFEPAGAVDECLSRALDDRQIEHTDPAPTPGWTNMQLPTFFGGVHVFFCDYHIPGAKDPLLRANALSDAGGGALQLERASGIILGTQQLASATAAWSRLFHPSPMSPANEWHFAEGPDVRIVEADDDEVLGLVLATRRDDADAALESMRNAGDPLHGLSIAFEHV